MRFSDLFKRRSGKSERMICPVCGCIFISAPFCPACGAPAQDDEEEFFPDKDARGRRGKWKSDLDHCARCGKGFREKGDRFCRFCGQERKGPGRYFVPSPEFMELVYGPPPATLYYHCPACGKDWSGSNWSQESYCPDCGAALSQPPKEKEEYLLDPVPRAVLALVDLREPVRRLEATVRDSVLVGRDRACGLCLFYENTVSKRHCEIYREADGYSVADLSSVNGTSVNGVRIQPGVRVPLPSGSVLTLGRAQLRFEAAEAGDRPEAERPRTERL